ncbi:MAG: phosphoglycerate kinase [Alphaproteobacteria bacterium]|nr:phosphoglycerate kinase [Alphaproteobacteria bacterium]
MELSGKIVLVRVDFNVPMDGGTIMDDARIKVPVATVKELKNRGAKVVLMSHMGKTSDQAEAPSLRQLIPVIEKIYGNSVLFIEDYLGENARSLIEKAPHDDLVFFENLRFHPQEESCDLDFARKLASLGDFFVNEAFSVSHRKHASVFGIPQFLPSDLGENFKKEIKNIERFFNHSSGKRMAIIGGSKLSTKIKLLKRLVTKVDKLALGGGIAGAFLSYFKNDISGIFEFGEYEADVKEIVENAKKFGCELIVPTDFSALISTKSDHAIMRSEDSNTTVFDIGPDSVKLLEDHILTSDMVLWNGPVGLFERSPFEFGTKTIAEFIAERTQNHHLISIIGGGDTGFAMKKFGVADKMTCISTAGGAFLNYVENEDCLALEAIRISHNKFGEL